MTVKSISRIVHSEMNENRKVLHFKMHTVPNAIVVIIVIIFFFITIIVSSGFDKKIIYDNNAPRIRTRCRYFALLNFAPRTPVTYDPFPEVVGHSGLRARSHALRGQYYDIAVANRSYLSENDRSPAAAAVTRCPVTYV